jgi:hypothetical protein
MNHTSRDLLYLLDEHKATETLSGLDISELPRLNIKVQHQSNNDGVQIDGNIGASYIDLKLAGNHCEVQIGLPIQEGVPKLIQSADAGTFNLLMQA